MAVELDNAVIGSPNLQIDFRAACLPQQPLRFVHYGSPKTKALVLWRNRHVIEPPTMPLVTRHRRRHNLTSQHPDREQIRPHPEFAAHILARVIPRPDQIALPPQRHHFFHVLKLEGANLHVRRLVRLSHASVYQAIWFYASHTPLQLLLDVPVDL